MAVWGWCSPACCCQPAVAAGFIPADLRSKLNTHLVPQAFIIYCSPGCDCHCYKLSPFQAHWGWWHCTCFLRPACLFTAHTGSGSSPLSCGVFLPPLLPQAFPLLVAQRVPPLLPSLAGLFIYSSVMDCPSPPLVLRVPRPLCIVSFLLLLISQFFFLFSLGGGWSVQGAMLIWPRVVCGSTACRLAHLVVCIFPAIWALASGSTGALLVSPFNMK
jgi:hypothetical protein